MISLSIFKFILDYFYTKHVSLLWIYGFRYGYVWWFCLLCGVSREREIEKKELSNIMGNNRKMCLNNY